MTIGLWTHTKDQSVRYQKWRTSHYTSENQRISKKYIDVEQTAGITNTSRGKEEKPQWNFERYSEGGIEQAKAKHKKGNQEERGREREANRAGKPSRNKTHHVQHSGNNCKTRGKESLSLPRGLSITLSSLIKLATLIDTVPCSYT